MRILRSMAMLGVVALVASACSADAGEVTTTSAAATTTVAVETTTTQPSTQPQCAPWVGEMVAEFAEASGAVGIAASVATPDCTELVSVGYDDAAAGTPLDAEGTFRIASITKTFTATVAVRLAELGAWSLDDPVGDYVEGDYGEITVEQILSHTSGLADVEYEGSLWDYLMDPASVADRTRAIDSSLASPTRVAPGSIQRYANVNYLIAGYAIEGASGSSFTDELQTHVMGVLRLEDTGLETDDTELPEHYERAPEGGTTPIPLSALPTAIGSAAAWSAGGMVSSLDNLNAFVDGLFGGQLVSAESLELITDGFEGARSGYGLGINVLSVDGVPVYGHNGRIIGFASAFRHAPDVGITVVVLTNDGAADVPILAEDLVERALDG